jgi:SAM-dependent methyltransferase
MAYRMAARDTFEVGRLAPMADQTTSVELQARPDRTPEYGSYYYRHDCGIPYERNEHWLSFFGDVADGIVRNLHPTSVLDAGCAMGFLVEALHKRGVDARGIDISEYAVSQVDESVRDRCQVGTLTEPLGRRYDLITCIEVLEHIPAPETDKVIANLCSSTDRLLLSSTPADYGEATHLNVQPPEAWSALLAREGFFRDLEQDFSYLAPWAALYTRIEQPPIETVRRYDRAWWRLRHEASEVRAALLATQEQLAEMEERTETENRSEMGAEIDRLKEENLRLRDLLVGKDAELGAARGQLAVAEDQSQRLANAASRIQARIPGFMRLGGAILRRVQGRRR